MLVVRTILVPMPCKIKNKCMCIQYYKNVGNIFIKKCYKWFWENLPLLKIKVFDNINCPDIWNYVKLGSEENFQIQGDFPQLFN